MSSKPSPAASSSGIHVRRLRSRRGGSRSVPRRCSRARGIRPPRAQRRAGRREADQPGWRRFVHAPSARNSIDPDAWLPAIPSARASAVGVEAEQQPRRRRRAERAARPGGVEAARVVLGGLQRHREARGDLVARDRGAQQRVAARTARARRPPARPGRRSRRDGSSRPDACRPSRARARRRRWRARPAARAAARSCPSTVQSPRSARRSRPRRSATLDSSPAPPERDAEEVEEQIARRASEHLRGQRGARAARRPRRPVARERTGGSRSVLRRARRRHVPLPAREPIVALVVAQARLEHAFAAARRDAGRPCPAQTPVARPAR